MKVCLTLDQYRAGAESILRLKDLFKITGDFTDMLNILEAVILINIYEPLHVYVLKNSFSFLYFCCCLSSMLHASQSKARLHCAHYSL